MAASMTGYGRAKNENERWSCTVEIKSVNHRFLDVSVRTPRLFVCLEEPIKSKVSQGISRGKVDIFVTLEARGGSDTRIALNRGVVDSYISCAEELARELGLSGSLGIAELMRMPDVFTVEKCEVDLEALTVFAADTAAQALEAFLKARTTEGVRLKDDILQRLVVIDSLSGRVNERWPRTVEEYREKLEARMREVLESTTVEPQRILTEAAIFADKVAINEELVRLAAHIASMRSLLCEDEAIGRKLDFITQEMGREINTIGSKGNDLEIAQLVVDLKAELEKIREQVQNIE